MATLTTLRNVVARKMGMDNTASSNDQTLLDEWANQGVIDVLLRTHCFVHCYDLTLTANAWKYDLPTTPLAIKEITRPSASGRCIQVTPGEIFERRRTNAASSNYSDVTDLLYAVYGENLLLLYPTPTAADTLEVFEVPRPANDLATGSDSPAATAYGGVPPELHKGIEMYMLWQAGEYQEDPRSQAGQSYHSQYEDWIRRVARPAVNHKGGSILPRARTKRLRVPQHSNDTYPRV